jgi:hypothetical protein
VRLFRNYVTFLKNFISKQDRTKVLLETKDNKKGNQ